MTIEILLSDSVDPWFNLAVEDWIFLDRNDVDHILFLWRNADTVVVGRSQNPWLECHLENMKRDNVKLARRQSGGGAVFHDLGNTNFTFMSKKQGYDKQANIQIVCAALARLGVEVQAQGRNDLVMNVQGQWRKISGSAYKEKIDRCFHHGTLLLSADLGRLSDYLNPNPLKLKAKGVTSVRSRVANVSSVVSGVHHEGVCHVIAEEFGKYYCQKVEPVVLQASDLKGLTKLQTRYRDLSSWDWLYGQTLPFTHRFEVRFDWATIDLRCQVESARIVSVQCFTDCLDVEFVRLIEKQLVNVAYCCEALSQLIEHLVTRFPDYAQYVRDLIGVMIQDVQVQS